MYFHRNIVATAVRVSVHRMAECRKKTVWFSDFFVKFLTFFLFKLKKPQNFFNVVIFLQIIFHKPRRSIKIRSKYLHFQIMNTNKLWITSCPKARAFFESVQLWKTYLGFKQNFGNQTFQAFSTRINSMNSNLDLKLWPIGANQN